MPACILELKQKKIRLLSDKAAKELTTWLHGVMTRAKLVKNGKFLAKGGIQEEGLPRQRWPRGFAKSWAAVGTDKPMSSGIESKELSCLAD